MSESSFGGLVDGFVGEGSRSADNADFAISVDVAGHDADFAFVGFDYAGAVGADDSGFVLGPEGVLDFDHVVLGDAFFRGGVPSVMTTQS